MDIYVFARSKKIADRYFKTINKPGSRLKYAKNARELEGKKFCYVEVSSWYMRRDSAYLKYLIENKKNVRRVTIAEAMDADRRFKEAGE